MSKRVIAAMLILLICLVAGSAGIIRLIAKPVAQKQPVSGTSRRTQSHQVVLKPHHASKIPTTPSSVTSHVIYSKALQQNWHYRVYLPKNYARLKTDGQHFASIYMLHGLYGDETNLTTQAHSKQVLDQLVNSQHLPVVVIFPDGSNSFYLDTETQKMASAIMTELIPKMTTTYQLAGAKHRAVGGISMGGYGAANLTLRHPNAFHTAALISPAVWQQVPQTVQANTQISAFKHNGAFSKALYDQNQPTRYLGTYLKKDRQPAAFYIESTSHDTTVPIAAVNQFTNALKRQHIPVTYQIDHFGNHNWTYWNHALPLAYRFIFQHLKN